MQIVFPFPTPLELNTAFSFAFVWNFRSFKHVRLLQPVTTSGRLEPALDPVCAAQETERDPEKTNEKPARAELKVATGRQFPSRVEVG